MRGCSSDPLASRLILPCPDPLAAAQAVCSALPVFLVPPRLVPPHHVPPVLSCRIPLPTTPHAPSCPSPLVTACPVPRLSPRHAQFCPPCPAKPHPAPPAARPAVFRPAHLLSRPTPPNPAMRPCAMMSVATTPVCAHFCPTRVPHWPCPRQSCDDSAPTPLCISSKNVAVGRPI